MNRHSALTLGVSVALVMFAALAFPSAIRSGPTNVSASVSTARTYQVSAHVVRRSGYIVASS